MTNSGPTENACPDCKKLSKIIGLIGETLNEAYKVRDLDWKKHEGQSVIHTAHTIFGTFIIYPTKRDFHFELVNSNFSGNSNEVSEAMRRCNHHFQSLLEPHLIPASLTLR